MSNASTPTVGPPEEGPRPRRPAQPLLAAIMVAISALLLAVALSQTRVTYALPTPPGGRTVSHARQIYGPGVLAAVVALLAVLSAIGWLIWSVVGRPSRRWWSIPAGLIVLAAGLTVGAVVGDRPSF